MKIAIIGTGAMGSIYAARFAKAGHEVIAVDIWQEHVDQINKDGLVVEGPGPSTTKPSLFIWSTCSCQISTCLLYTSDAADE